MTEKKSQKASSGSEILLYQTEDGRSEIQVRFDEGSVWLTQTQMAELFQTTKQNISLHLKNIFDDKELEPHSVVKECLITAADGKSYSTNHRGGLTRRQKRMTGRLIAYPGKLNAKPSRGSHDHPARRSDFKPLELEAPAADLA